VAYSSGPSFANQSKVLSKHSYLRRRFTVTTGTSSRRVLIAHLARALLHNFIVRMSFIAAGTIVAL